jgi:flagellar basal body L-ring protein FlgH
MNIYRNRVKYSERSAFTCLVERKRNGIKLLHIKGKKSSEKTDTRRSSKRLFLLLPLLFVFTGSTYSQSLWSSEFDGYISNARKIETGDLVVVKIDSEFSLTYRSSSIDSKGLTIELSGGEFGNLFSFLPDVKTRGDRSIKGTEEYSLTSRLVARVTDIDSDGLAFIQGSRTLAVEGKEESLTLSGWLDPRDITQTGEIEFSRVANTKITYQSFLQPSETILTDKDIVSILQDLTASGEALASATPEGAVEAKAVVGLTDEKKKELFLMYVNRLVDLIFQ